MQQKDSKNSFGKKESSKKTEKERKITSKKAARLITWAEAKAERGLIPGSDQEREGRLQPYAIRSSRRKKQQQLVDW
ncbi:hypothetical protein Tco_1032967 [Tanacetum coccineum]|uniref:Uncharacterized protein n=1 Tax=Tanacetum coccineum TaxID=301880 RepID=A0ABQ5GDE6_9ASTR